MAFIGKLRFNWRGVWVSGTNYKPDDMVQYKGQTYICNANTSSTTSPQDRLTTSSDNPGTAGTDWTLYSHTGLGGDANRGDTGYKSSNTFMFGTNRSSHGHLSNSYWRAGTYYHGDTVTFIANNGVNGTYRVKGTSTTLPPANNTVNPTSGWDRIAFGTASPNKTALVHPDCFEPFPNQGYILRNRWSGNNMTGNSSPAWYGDTYGYAVTDSTQYFMGSCCFVNKNFLPVTIPGDGIASGASAPPFEDADSDWVSSEVPFRHLDYLDGVLPTPDGDPPKVEMMLKDYSGTAVLFNNGEVHYYGDNTKGQAGRGTTTDEQQGGFNRWGYANVNRTGETKVLRGKKATRIAMTLGNTTNVGTSVYALISYGANNTNEIWGAGNNDYGQHARSDVSVDSLVPTHMTDGANGWNQASFGNPVDIWATGGSYGRIWALTQTGKMYACGYNAHGQLGIGNTTSNITAWTLVKDWGTVGGIKKFATSGNQYNVCAVVAGNGTLWTWGENAAGALGHGDTTDRTSPTQVGSDTDWINCWVFCPHTTTSFVTMATKGTSEKVNSLYAFGDGANYVLGQGNQTDQTSPVQPKDSYGNNITNIINVKPIGGGGGNANIGLGLEQYIADTSIDNQNGYKTRWYIQGDLLVGHFELGYTALAANTLDADLPKPSASSTEQYYYHQNMRFFPGVNPYRVSLQSRGYSTATSAIIYFDKDVGRVIHSGAGYYGLDIQSAPGDPPAEGTDAETFAVTVPLPGN